MALFRYTLENGETIESDDIDIRIAPQIVELIFCRNATRFQMDGIRQNQSHPLHEAASSNLPPNLRVLRAIGCKLRTWPALPTRIIECYLSGNWFLALPDLSAYTSLIVLELEDNNIPAVDCPLPPSLARLNLCCNAIRTFTAQVPVSCESITTESNPYNPYPVPQPRMRATEPRTSYESIYKYDSIYTNNQNIHDSAVQSSTSKNLAYLNAYKPTIRHRKWRVLLRDIRRAFAENIPEEDPSYILAEYVNRPYSMHGMTFHRLVDRVWLRIQDIDDAAIRLEAMHRFYEEVQEGYTKCINGMMVRIVNSLIGYDEHIEIELTYTQILSMRVPATLTRLLSRFCGIETIDYWTACYIETVKDLVDVNAPKSEWQSWLHPLAEPVLENLAKHLKNGEPVVDQIKKCGLQGFDWEIAAFPDTMTLPPLPPSPPSSPTLDSTPPTFHVVSNIGSEV